MKMPGCHQIVQNGEPGEKLYVLKGSSDAQASNLVGWKMVDALIFESHLPLLGAIKSVDAIEDACFSGSVGPNDRKHLSLPDFESDARECGDSPEAQPYIVDF